MPINLAGKVAFFSGEFGGSDGRRPIDAKTKTPNEDYVLCDGIETNGIIIPNLRGLMIICTSDDHPIGETGGSNTATFTMKGTVGDCTLTIQQMPRHTHTYTCYAGKEGSGHNYEQWYADSTQNTGATGNSQPHTHPIEGTVSVERSLPPYYALAPVMYIGDYNKKPPHLCGGLAHSITEQQRLGVHLEVVTDGEASSTEAVLFTSRLLTVVSETPIMLAGGTGFNSRLFLPSRFLLGHLLFFRHSRLLRSQHGAC